jgi:hypothetical protein
MSNTSLTAIQNNYEVTILPILLNFLDRNKHYAVNLSVIEKELTITLINGNKIKRIAGKNLIKLSESLKKILKVR